jgi:pilus assembly protein CpaF
MVWSDASRHGELHHHLDDPDVMEVMVVGGREVWVEKRSGMSRAEDLAEGRFMVLAERLLRHTGRRVDVASPVAEARLADGSRLAVVLPPVAVDGGALCIRKFAPHALSLDDFCDPPTARRLAELVTARCNIVVSGATSAGKTSLLMAMARHVDDRERVVTVEDTCELDLPLSHVLRLQARTANLEGTGAVDMAALVRLAMRLRPDRIVVGEVRGAEVVDMLLALSSGHTGSWTTCHAGSSADALGRLRAMILRSHPQWTPQAADDLIGSAIDAVVHLDPPPHRRVACITDVTGRGAGIDR